MFRSKFWSARYWKARFFGPAEDGGAGDIYVPPARRRQPKGAEVTLRGVEFRILPGTLTVSAGVRVTLAGVEASISSGGLEAEGVQNPTADEIALLLSLDAVAGD